MAKLLASSGDPDQTPHFVAFDLGLHCLPIACPFQGYPDYTGLNEIPAVWSKSSIASR